MDTLFADETGRSAMHPRQASTPDVRARGRDEPERIRHASAPLSFGTLLLACAGDSVIAIELADDEPGARALLHARFPDAILVADPIGLRAMLATICDAIATGRTPDLALAPRGSAFQQRVWDALRRIPRGSTVGYGELARRIGAPTSTRAVASACGANPLAVLVPCHRVRRGDGSAGGFRWGLARKRALLALEGVAPGAGAP